MTWVGPANAAGKSKHSKVSIDLEPMGEKIRLTVAHEELTPEVLKGITYG